jgi:hypothetical protein
MNQEFKKKKKKLEYQGRHGRLVEARPLKKRKELINIMP